MLFSDKANSALDSLSAQVMEVHFSAKLSRLLKAILFQSLKNSVHKLCYWLKLPKRSLFSVKHYFFVLMHGTVSARRPYSVYLFICLSLDFSWSEHTQLVCLRVYSLCYYPPEWPTRQRILTNNSVVLGWNPQYGAVFNKAGSLRC